MIGIVFVLYILISIGKGQFEGITLQYIFILLQSEFSCKPIAVLFSKQQLLYFSYKWWKISVSSESYIWYFVIYWQYEFWCFWKVMKIFLIMNILKKLEWLIWTFLAPKKLTYTLSHLFNAIIAFPTFKFQSYCKH